MRSQTGISLCILMLCGAFEGVRDASAADPVYCNRPRFHIPFQYDSQEIARVGTKQVLLFVSRDRGQTWQHVQSVTPNTKRFDFQAVGDGEYWFAVRTLDSTNWNQPNARFHEPGLKVVVDTTPPTLDVRLAQQSAGQLRVDWQAADEHLETESLKIDSMQAGSQAWKPMPFTPRATGETTWDLPAGGLIAVRGQVADRAGNTAVAQAQIQLLPGDSAPPVQPAGPIAGIDALPTSTPIAKEASQKRPAVPPAVERFAAASEPPSQPAGERFVTFHKFHIMYDLDDIAPEDIGGIELFITENDGQKWWRYGFDDDRQSPMPVEVHRDGRYGFAMRVHDASGSSPPPPQPDERPSIVVMVDTTPPKVQLRPLQQGPGDDSNQVVIQWTLEDAHPAAKPIGLFYATEPRGPWTPISDWQADEGHYLWIADTEVPPRVYIRLSARDKAGNTVDVESPTPIQLRTTGPTARIVDVQAIDTPKVQR